MGKILKDVQADANDTRATLDAVAGTGFTTTRDSLAVIRARGDIAWVTGVGATATDVYTIDTLVRTVGDADFGDSNNVNVVDGTYFTTGEVGTTTLLEVDAAFTAADVNELPVAVTMWGFYYGGGGHYIDVQAYNYIDTGYETVGTIGIGTEVEEHSFSLNPQHINTATGAMAIKFLHSTGSGITAHYLAIDKLIVTTYDLTSATLTFDANDVDAIGDAVWDELLSGHTTSGSAGVILKQSGLSR